MERRQVVDLLLQKTYRYLAPRPRSRHELEEYIVKKCTSSLVKQARVTVDALVLDVMKHLEELGYVDDRQFIDWWVAARSGAKPKGKRAIFSELRQKGIVKEEIEDYFLHTMFDEQSLCEKALSARWSRLSGLERKDRFEKAMRHLLSRGFSYEVAKKAFYKSEKIE